QQKTSNETISGTEAANTFFVQDVMDAFPMEDKEISAYMDYYKANLAQIARTMQKGYKAHLLKAGVVPEEANQECDRLFTGEDAMRASIGILLPMVLSNLKESPDIPGKFAEKVRKAVVNLLCGYFSVQETIRKRN